VIEKSPKSFGLFYKWRFSGNKKPAFKPVFQEQQRVLTA
jgi:hypothetical protein